ncbi:MAG: hypothetical protein AAGD10_18965 [Myxococcota bacterium]
MGRLASYLLFLLAGFGCTSAGPKTPEGQMPAEVFAPWNGVWKGRFEVLKRNEVLTRLDVVQKYWSESPNEQRAVFEERNVQTGERVTKKALNSRKGDDLRCRVTGPDEEVEHRGRWTGKGLEWFRKTEDLEEHFFEVVETDANGRTYYIIEGWGRYGGGDRLEFRARYKKVGTEEEARHLATEGDPKVRQL